MRVFSRNSVFLIKVKDVKVSIIPKEYIWCLFGDIKVFWVLIYLDWFYGYIFLIPINNE